MLSKSILLLTFPAFGWQFDVGHPMRLLPGAPARVSAFSPFPAGCEGTQTGFNYRNAAVEPMIVADPRQPGHLVGVWQQDRWTNGGANGLLTVVTTDQGRTWTTSSAAFSNCTGGSDVRASDPWVTISPDGTAYQIALGLSNNNNTTSVLVSRSADGGFLWSDPVTLVRNTGGGDDKESITADPEDARFVYAVWDRSTANTFRIPVWFSRTADGGASWDAPRIILDNGVGTAGTANQIVVLPDGTLVDVFVHFATRSPNSPLIQLAVIRSTNHGVTWSSPIVVASDETIGTVDAKTQLPIRAANGIPSAAVDPTSGAIYIVWQDARFSGQVRDGVAFTRSVDGGLTWSTPVQVNQAPDVQSFTPAVAVNASGAIAVTYYDFRKDTNDLNTLLANYWKVVSTDGGNSWHETPVAGPFDLLSAPQANGAPFLGDYAGLAAAGDTFLSFFVAANSDASIASSVYFATGERPGDTRPNGRVEINLYPRRMQIGPKPDPGASRARHARR